MPVDWATSLTGGKPPVTSLLDASRRLLNGADVDLVTIDMPVATTVIRGRRACDSAISKEFGARWCSTHTPSTSRPGEMSDSLRTDFDGQRYPLAIKGTPVGTTPALVEVYPHTALLVLMDADRRVPYKIARAGKYWPNLAPAERRLKILRTWQEIHERLGVSISGADLPLLGLDALPPGNRRFKPYEDALDALICGWVGIQYLSGNCVPYGDETAAIWTP
jgi:predicted RNase H-like nuclease